MTSFDATTGRIGALTVDRPLAEVGLGGVGGGVKFSPDGSKAFFVTARTTVVLRNTSDGSERSIVPQMSRLRRLEWSSDSQSLMASGLSVDKEGLHRIDLATGAATLLFESGPVPMFAPSPDGRTVFYRTAQGPLVARDLTTGVERRLLGGEVGLSAVVPSRDGSKLALTTGSRLVIVDTRTGTSSVRWEAPGDTTDIVRGGAWSPNDQHFVTIAGVGSGERRFELWTFNAANGPPLRQPLPAQFRTASMSADGRQLALVRWENLQQVWTLENFLPPAK